MYATLRRSIIRANPFRRWHCETATIRNSEERTNFSSITYNWEGYGDLDGGYESQFLSVFRVLSVMHAGGPRGVIIRR